MSIYLAVDLGTTGCRSILFDDALSELASAYEEYGLITPDARSVEQDAELWWELTLRTAKAAIDKSEIDPLGIKGISISSQGITIVPVDRELKPMCNALTWLDMRAEEETAFLREDYGDGAMFTLTGKHIDAAYTLPKLLWMKKHMAETFNNAWKFLMPMDFLIARLTGQCVTDHSMASGTLLFDIKNGVWSREILDRYGIPEEKLPEIRRSGACAGKILPHVAAELGLGPDCVAAVGAQDQKCAALGAGLDMKTMTISLGTAAAVTKKWASPLTEEHTAVGWGGYAEEGAWVTEGVVNTAGTCLRWLRDIAYRGESYRVLDEEAEHVRRNNTVLFIPNMSGAPSPGYHPEEEGCFYGINLSTVRGNLAAAVMEGIAFEIRELLGKMDAYGNVERMVIFGGGAKSDLWCRIIADVTGLSLTVPTTAEAAGAGAAILAAKAVGVCLPPLPEARVFTPSEDRTPYEERYRAYCSLKNRN
ncbi:MAG: hypothetical protein E7638_05740 [Ruminococcaceae bacterium]|nr:hypothetical protein [Oscillospiraceae bacterium]